jgi:hypothetical protein
MQELLSAKKGGYPDLAVFSDEWRARDTRCANRILLLLFVWSHAILKPDFNVGY